MSNCKDEIDLKEMTGEELWSEFRKSLVESTPQELARVIQDMEQIDAFKSSKFLLLVKTVAFRDMLLQLNIPSYKTARVRGAKTELYIDTEFNQSFLFITKKDRENFHLVYPKLYDQHKDELLQIIEARNTANSNKEMGQHD